jgi:hypothetical protein
VGVVTMHALLYVASRIASHKNVENTEKMGSSSTSVMTVVTVVTVVTVNLQGGGDDDACAPARCRAESHAAKLLKIQRK